MNIKDVIRESTTGEYSCMPEIWVDTLDKAIKDHILSGLPEEKENILHMTDRDVLDDKEIDGFNQALNLIRKVVEDG